MTRALARLVFVAVGAAIAVWLLPASIHIVSWPPTGPVRVALIAPLWRLWGCLAVAAVFLAGVAVAGRVYGAHVPRRMAAVLDPFALLWLCIVPYLPWLPDRAPLLLALEGPLRWMIAGVATLGTLASCATRRGWRFSITPQPGRRSVFALSLAMYLAFGFSSATTIGPGGDEPHYLIITQSLLVDHDLAIENNHARRDYREFFGGELRPDYLQRGLHEVIYSVHAPGLPALLLPAYAVAGYRGAVAMMCLIAALAALAVFELAELLVGRGGALLTWIAVCVTVPFVPHAWMIYPEMPAALIVAWAALWLWKPLPERLAPWVWRGLALAVLPWLHTKFVIFLALLTAFLLVRLWPRVRFGVALVTPIAISISLWLYSFYRMYGVIDPEAPYGAYMRLNVLSVNIPRGLLGLLFDQKFGLLVYSPVYGFAAVGGWLMLRRTELRAFAAALASAATVYVTSSARLYMWWGGSSAPARFLVPILPLLAPMVATAIGAVRGTVGRSALGVAIAVGVVISIASSGLPDQLLMFSDPHGYARIVEVLQGASPLAVMLPTFTDENWRAPISLLWPWAIAGLVSLIVAATLGPRRPVLARFWTAVIGILTFGLVGSIVAGRPGAPDRTAITARGQLSLMNAYDGSRLSGFDYPRLAELDEKQVLAASALVVPRRPETPVQDPQRLEGPFELPPGRYESHLWFEGGPTRDGEAFLTLKNQVVLARTRGPLNNPASMSLELPVPAVIWVGLSPEAAARTVRRVEIVPRSLVPRSERPALEIHAMEPISNRPGAYIAYADANTYPEGGVFWTRDTRQGHVFVASAGASTLLLTLHLGPVGGIVRLSVGGQSRDVSLAHDETRQVEVQVPAGLPLVPVSVQAPGTFRPADVDLTSDDVRWLGCQVRVELR